MTKPRIRRIDLFGVYSLDEVNGFSRLSRAAIIREVRSGRLRSAIIGRKRIILGEWIVEWIRQAEVQHECAPTVHS